MGRDKGPAQPKKGAKGKDDGAGAGGKRKPGSGAAAADGEKQPAVCAEQEVRHILVEKQSKAIEVLEIIRMGKMSFNEAAREYSIDKAGRSGLLGWKKRTELDQDFWAASLLLDVGDYTKEPVKTEWGYHIIMVQARK